MTLLPQLELELHEAAGRPTIRRRLTTVALVAVIAATVALLMAPPTVARRTAPVGATLASISR